MDPHSTSYTVRMLEHFVHRQHLCIVFEILNVNLYDILRRTNFAGLSMGLVRRFAQVLLVGAKCDRGTDRARFLGSKLCIRCTFCRQSM